MKRNLQGDLKLLPRALTAKICGKRCDIPKPCLQALLHQMQIRRQAWTTEQVANGALGTSNNPRNPHRAASGIKQWWGNDFARSRSDCINQRYGLTNLPAHPSATLRSTCKARWRLLARGHGSAAAKCWSARTRALHGVGKKTSTLSREVPCKRFSPKMCRLCLLQTST